MYVSESWTWLSSGNLKICLQQKAIVERDSISDRIESENGNQWGIPNFSFGDLEGTNYDQPVDLGVPSDKLSTATSVMKKPVTS